MNELEAFTNKIKEIRDEHKDFTVEDARKILKLINDFLYANYDGIGTLEVWDRTFEYFSDFHKYWENHYREILDITINEDNCELVADKLHEVYLNTEGTVFSELYNTAELTPEEICLIRFLTANQDFRGSRNFNDFIVKYQNDPDYFNIQGIYDNPIDFIGYIDVANLSQNDKRVTFARNISGFLLERHTTPYGLLDYYGRNLSQLRNDLINCIGAGYGNKKTDMFIRDMVVLGVWNNYSGFEDIDVASDVNTIKVALRTGIMTSKIPLVTSFLDIFCYQYSYVDEMNARAWRRVWEKWNEKYPGETLASPSLIDYFIYRIVGKELCKSSLYLYRCENDHSFKWHTFNKRKCPICRGQAEKIGSIYPCNDEEGNIVVSRFLNTYTNCPFKDICDTCGNKNLQPPTSISIMGKTGWTSAYTKIDNGGGGLMA